MLVAERLLDNMNRFQKIINKLKTLKQYDKYEAALIFGSHARGGANNDSDVDAIVISIEDRKEIILHPYIDGIKLDLSYYSFKQFEELTDKGLKKSPDREPLVAGCIILFDKTGRLTKLVKKLDKVRPQKWTREMESEQRFLMYHANDKVVRNLEKDPVSSLFSMNIGVNDLLKTHYLINEKWWLSNKKLLDDLRSWDHKMYELLEHFLKASSIQRRYSYWKKIYEYILSQIGGLKPLDENIPDEFQKDIQLIID